MNIFKFLLTGGVLELIEMNDLKIFNKFTLKQVSQFIMLIIFALFFISCKKNNEIKETNKNHLKIVSLAPSLTELIFYLGKGKNLIGRTTACNYPKEAEKITAVGAFGQPSLEKLLSLKPDIVVATALADENIKQTIEEYGIKFLLLPTDNFKNYKCTLKELGNALNCSVAANKEIIKFEKTLKEFSEANSQKSKHPKVYLEIWNKPYMTIGKKSFINTMINYAGGENIFGNIDKGYFNFSIESLIKSDPEIIIAPSMNEDGVKVIENRPGWEKISAIENHRVYTNLNSDLIFRLGPRTIQGIKLLRSIINNEFTKNHEK